MRRRYLLYDPHTKFFTTRKDGTIPRLLTPEEETYAVEYEARPSYKHEEGELEIYMNWAIAFAHW